MLIGMGVGFGMLLMLGATFWVRAVAPGEVSNPIFAPPADDVIDTGSWKPLSIRITGSGTAVLPGLPKGSAADLIVDLPPQVPVYANEVLVGISYFSNGFFGTSPNTFIEVWTEEAGVRYAVRIVARSAGLNRYSVSHDNVWLPVTPERKIRAHIDNDDPGLDSTSGIWILGYR